MKPRNETSLGPCGFVAMLGPQSTAIRVTLPTRDTRTPRCCRTNQTRSVNALAADDRSVLSRRGLATSPILQESTTLRTRAVVRGLSAPPGTIPSAVDLETGTVQANRPGMGTSSAGAAYRRFPCEVQEVERRAASSARVARTPRVAARRVRVAHHPIRASQGTCLPQL